MRKIRNTRLNKVRRLIEKLNDHERLIVKANLAPFPSEYYGDGVTIHDTTQLDVETYRGEVVSVWFRCRVMPFKQHRVEKARSTEMKDLYAGMDPVELTGVEINYPFVEDEEDADALQGE